MSRLDQLLALPSITHTLVQGSPEWDAFRLEHRGASEAAAALGLSKKVKRTELLHMKHTKVPREFSDWLQKNVLGNGHRVEGLARPHVEAWIGQDLYPVTRSRGDLSASCDGLTLDDLEAMEHKQWNEDLATMVAAGVLPDEHAPQCQQILLVTGAQKLHFVVSDGTPDKMVMLTVLPDRAWWERLVAGWDQFDEDLAAYEPAAPVEKIVAEPVEALPAVAVQVEGAIAIRENFDAFEQAMRNFLENRLIREPKSDQDFADLDQQIKAMKGAEAALDAAEASWIAQVEAVGAAKRRKDMLRTLVRDNRLMAERLLATEKDRRRTEIVTGGTSAFAEHIAALNQRLGRPYMPTIPADFAGCIKGLKSLASMEDKVSGELARAKIAANEVADRIQVNLAYLVEHASEHRALFPDTAQIVLKAPEDLQSLVTARLAEHRAAEEKRLEAERERIRREEQERAEEEAANTNRMRMSEISGIQQQVAIATLGRAGVRKGGTIQCIRETLAETEAWPIEESNFGPLTSMAQAAKDKAVSEIRDLLADAEEGEASARSLREAAGAPAQPIAAAPITPAAASSPAVNVVPMGTRAPAKAEPRTLTLTAIGQRLGFTLPATFVADKLGVAGEKDRSAVKFSEIEFVQICAALAHHIGVVLEQHRGQRVA